MPSNKIEMNLQDGMRIAHEFLDGPGQLMRLSATIAGSIRRLRPIVHDVDIVFSDDVDAYTYAIFMDDCERAANIQVHKWGPKLTAITYRGIPFDLYFSTPGTFHTLLLIRTGSKENNIRLCSIARSKGWKLHASGNGLFNERGERIAGDSERSIYDALGVPWQEPWERG